MTELEAIFERCKLGDALAWEALVRKTQARVFSIALFYVRDRAEAEDLAQEIFIKIYRKMHDLKESGSFLTWMIRLARNCSIDRLRRFKARPPAQDLVIDSDVELSNADASQEQAFDSQLRVKLLYQAMDKLSDQAREILFLKEIEQLKLTEIAEMLSLPIGTVKSRSNRARLELAKSVLALDPSYGAAAAKGG